MMSHNSIIHYESTKKKTASRILYKYLIMMVIQNDVLPEERNKVIISISLKYKRKKINIKKMKNYVSSEKHKIAKKIQRSF